jgi:hypothetical protein
MLDAPKLSKAMAVMKVLVEDTLRRDRHSRGTVLLQENIDLCLGAINGLVPPHRPLYVIADAFRFVQDFSVVMQRRCVHLSNVQYARGIEDSHIVSLITGGRTDSQRKIFGELINQLEHQRCIVWRIGHWRV